MGSCMDHKHFWRGLIKPRSKTFLLPLLGIHVLLFSHSTYAALNGMAVLNTFGKEKYIAALYVDTPTNNANSVFLQSNSASMEFLVVDRSISRRSMGRLWAESVAINADYTLFEKYFDTVTLRSRKNGSIYYCKNSLIHFCKDMYFTTQSTWPATPTGHCRCWNSTAAGTSPRACLSSSTWRNCTPSRS